MSKRILVFSDSHGYLDNMLEAIRDNIDHGVDMILHAGDHSQDTKAITREFPNIPLHNVLGNNDYDSTPDELVIEADKGVYIYITHGHRQNVYFSTSMMIKSTIKNNAHIGVFGHTHAKHLSQENGVAIFNSGSISMPRDGSEPSYGIITINSDSIDFQILGIYGSVFL